MLSQQERLIILRDCDCSSQAAVPSHRGRSIASGTLTLGIWILMPKCPVCVAAHVTFWTGLGISLTAAAYLRWSLLCLSGSVLLYLAVTFLRRRGNRGTDNTGTVVTRTSGP